MRSLNINIHNAIYGLYFKLLRNSSPAKAYNVESFGTNSNQTN